MRMRMYLTVVLLAACAATVSAQNVTVNVEDKTITPATLGFSLKIFVTNTTASAIPVSSADFYLSFSPSVGQNIGFVSVQLHEGYSWTDEHNQTPNEYLTDVFSFTASGGGSLLDPGTTEFLTLNLELAQPGPDQVKYDVALDFFLFGNAGNEVASGGGDPGTYGFIAVPEPGSVMAIGSLAGLLLMRRRRAA